MSQVNQAQHELEADHAQLQRGWAMWSKAAGPITEEDLGSSDPESRTRCVGSVVRHRIRKAHSGYTWKIYQNLYAKLNTSRGSNCGRNVSKRR